MPPVFAIAGKDLRQRLRDRSAIVLGLVAPLAIAALMSFAFRGTESFHINVGVVDADHGQVAAAFHDFMGSRELRKIVTAHAVNDEAALAKAVRDGTYSAGVVIPAGFSDAAAGTGVTNLGVLTSADATIAGDVMRSVASSFVAQVNADRLSVGAALAAGVPAGRAAALGEAASQARIPEEVARLPIGSKPLKAISYYGPAMAIFFLFFAIGFTARSFFSEQENGMFDRIAAAPVRRTTVLFGKSLSVFVYGLASLGTVVLFTSLLFGASWGSPYATAMLCIAIAIAVVALTALVIAIARTERQAEGLASIIVFGLALIGGNFISISSAPEFMRRLALGTPNGWALRGFTDLSTGVPGPTAVIRPVLAILLFSAVVAALAVVSARRWVTR